MMIEAEAEAARAAAHQTRVDRARGLYGPGALFLLDLAGDIGEDTHRRGEDRREYERDRRSEA